jgi:large subunit ribosomal protein L25
MQTVELSGNKRETASGGVMRALRAKGSVPAVVYGGRKEPVSLSVDGKELLSLLKGHGMNILVSLKVGTDGDTVLLKDLQRDFVTHDIIHVDFQRISMTDTLEVNVPLRIVGEAPGVKLGGGILEHILRDLRVRCLPSDIPSAVDVEISALQINQGLRVKDLRPASGVEILTDAEHFVVNVVAPSELEEAPATAAAAPGTAEPEVIAKGKKPEEGAEAAPAPVGKDAGKAAPAPAKGAAPAAKPAGK